MFFSLLTLKINLRIRTFFNVPTANYFPTLLIEERRELDAMDDADDEHIRDEEGEFLEILDHIYDAVRDDSPGDIDDDDEYHEQKSPKTDDKATNNDSILEPSKVTKNTTGENEKKVIAEIRYNIGKLKFGQLVGVQDTEIGKNGKKVKVERAIKITDQARSRGGYSINQYNRDLVKKYYRFYESFIKGSRTDKKKKYRFIITCICLSF